MNINFAGAIILVLSSAMLVSLVRIMVMLFLLLLNLLL